MVAGWYFSVPVIGLYFSLRCRHFIAAFLLTLVSSFVPGWVLRFGLLQFANAFGVAPAFVDTGGSLSLAGVQAGVMGVCLLGLKWRLEKRLFPFERTVA